MEHNVCGLRFFGLLIWGSRCLEYLVLTYAQLFASPKLHSCEVLCGKHLPSEEGWAKYSQGRSCSLSASVVDPFSFTLPSLLLTWNHLCILHSHKHGLTASSLNDHKSKCKWSAFKWCFPYDFQYLPLSAVPLYRVLWLCFLAPIMVTPGLINL